MKQTSTLILLSLLLQHDGKGIDAFVISPHHHRDSYSRIPLLPTTAASSDTTQQHSDRIRTGALSMAKYGDFFPFNKDIQPQDLSQKSVIRQSNPLLSATAAATRREPMRMPSQTPQVPYKAPGSQVTQFIDINAAMYRDRTVMLNKFIDDETANEFIAIMLYLRKEDSRQPISLYFNIPGGLLRPSLAIYDLIQNTKQHCRVETINLGFCAGMGAILCSAGSKGDRAAMPNSRFMLSRTGMDEVFRGQATDIALEVKNIKKWNDRMEEELAMLTGQDLERIRKDLKRDFYLSSDEAVRYGLIDQVYLPAPRKRAFGADEADLGAFAGGDDQKYQGQGGQQQRGGWGSRPPPNGGGADRRDDDDEEPKVLKG